ncbi:MAG: hypothetical protein KC472_07590, partial [Dehalococcoidia bacterium]|nr:hypothetical protein [Dehalococcoidia bacterium]
MVTMTRRLRRSDRRVPGAPAARLALAALALLAAALLGGCTGGSEEPTATATPSPTATETPTPTPTPTPEETLSPEAQALLDLVPEDAQPTLLSEHLTHQYRMAGYAAPPLIFRSPDPALTLTETTAVTDGVTVEVTFALAAAPTDLARVDYWIALDLPEDVQELSPAVVFGRAPSEPEAEVYVNGANGGVFYYDAVVEYLDELTRRVTVRIPPGWVTPDGVSIIVGGILDPDGLLLNVGTPTLISIDRVDAVDTRGLTEPGPIEHATSVPLDLGELWQGNLTTWSHPNVHATVMAPDNWFGHSEADALLLWGGLRDATGASHTVGFGLSEFDPGGRTAEEVLDEILAAAGDGYVEVDRTTDE